MRVWKMPKIYIVAAMLLLAMSIVLPASADKNTTTTSDINWVGSTLHYSEVLNQDMFPPTQPSCMDEKTLVTGVRGVVNGLETNVCLYNQGDWSYGRYTYDYRTWYGSGDTERGWAVRIGNSGPMHRLVNGIMPTVHIPNSDDAIQMSYRADLNNYLNIYKDYKDKLVKEVQPNGESTYSYNGSPDLTLARPNGVGLAVYHGPGVSNNGKWVVAETGLGFVRINIDTLQVKRFAAGSYEYVAGRASPTQLAVTNDGRHVAVVGSYPTLDSRSSYRLYDIANNCGDAITDTTTGRTKIAVPCASRSFETVLRDNYSPHLDHALGLSFDDGGGQLTVQAFTGSGQKPPKWAQLTTDGYVPDKHLTYLALGDSYSSGEGDIRAGGVHYLSGTGSEKGCHLSDRSYPFLLRDYYGIPADNMRSVACSGAQVVFDYIGDDTNYLGQGNRLKQKTTAERQKEQKIALNTFTPGEIKQIDFVKEYKPSVTTLTGGGNDVGFAEILTYCASPNMVWKIPVPYTCEYAKSGSYLNKMLYDSIDSQYEYNKMFIDAIKNTSPKTRIIFIGYPSFVSSDLPLCALNAGSLDVKEREMINKAVLYMNSMLSQLAHDTSISYVDTTNALVGGRICEPGSYVTGVRDLGINKNLNNYRQESFHPNAVGHSLLADDIENSKAFTDGNIPGSTGYIISSGSTTTLPLVLLRYGEDALMISSPITVATDVRLFLPGSLIKLVGHSDPINLGSYTASPNGSLSATIPAGILPAGNHVVVASGKDYSGKPIRYYQFVSVLPEPQLTRDEGKSINSRDGTESLGGTPTSQVDYKNDPSIDTGNGNSHEHNSIDHLVRPTLHHTITPADATGNPLFHSVQLWLTQSWLLVGVFVVMLLGGIFYAIKKR